MLISANLSFAQGLINDGATVKISPDIYVVIDGTGNLTNQNSGTIDLEGYLTLAGNLTNNATFNIKSGASFINSGTIGGTGTTNVEQDFIANQAHYITKPVTSANVTDFTGAFVFEYNEGTSEWEDLTSGSLSEMKGYSVEFLSANNTVTFSGSLNTGSQSINVNNAASGWNLVGNPYSSAIDWDATTGWTKTNVNDAIYCWDGAVGNYAYYVGGSGTNGGTNIIPAMQGFFVKTTGSGQVAVTNDVRLHNAQSFFKNSNSQKQGIRLLAKGNGYQDEALVLFNTQADNDFDSEFDAHKLITTSKEVPQIYTVTDFGTDLAINSLPELNNETVIKFNFTAGQNGEYSISVKELNLDAVNKIYLEDKKEETFTELAIGNEYKYAYLISDYSNRFNIHFNKSTTGFEDINNTESNIKIYAAGKNINIKSVNLKNSDAIFMVYDLSGKVLYNDNLKLSNSNTVNTNLQSGTYIVKLTVNNTVISEKVFVD